MSTPRISLVITADTRPGMDAEQFTVGDDGGQGSLHGVRHLDLLSHGVLQKVRFFRGFDIELIVCIDVHLPVPDEVRAFIMDIPKENKFVSRVRILEGTADKSHPRWFDKIQLDALRHADGQYIAKFDQDANAMTGFPCDVVDDLLQVLDRKEANFVCQQSDLHPSVHGMWWASTRFFMCRREILDFPALERAAEKPTTIFEKYAWAGAQHLPCMEHVLGVMGSINGKCGVFYPPLQAHRWIVWSWARYCKGVLEKLNAMPYAEAADIIVNKWGLCGPADCVAQPL